MIISLLFLLFLLSFTVHLSFIVMYVISRGKKSFNGFLVSAATNMVIMIILTVLTFKSPDLIKNLDMSMLLWNISGFVLVMTLSMQIIISIRIYKKIKQPEFFHFNYFGKKVFHKGLVSKAEFLIFLITLPFFLIVGAYFVARLINLIKSGHI